MSFGNLVYQQLDNMKPGEKIILAPAHPNYSRFIEIVKEYIDTHRYGNGIEFSGDYKTVRKQNWPVPIEKKILDATDTQ